MTSVYPFWVVGGAVGLYAPSLPFVKGTTTNLNPVVGARFQEPWKVTYKLLDVASNLLSMGAEWAWKVRAGGVDTPLQLASLNVLFGAITN